MRFRPLVKVASHAAAATLCHPMATSSADASTELKPVLVTGGAGFIGSNLAAKLASDGRPVVIADTFATGDWRNCVEPLKAGADVVTLDDPLALDALWRLGPFETIYHQAAITGVVADDGAADVSANATRRMLSNNVEQFRLILDYAADSGAAVVWASSCSLYGRGPVPMVESAKPDPLNIYALSKLAKEKMAERYAPRLAHPIVGLRYSNVYGPGEDHKGPLASMPHKLAKQMRAGHRPRVFEHGGQRRDFVYVADAVAANLAANDAILARRLEQGRAYSVNAGAGRSWTFNELIDELNRVLKTDLSPDYFPNPYDFTQDHTETDQSLALETIGYAPKYDLAQGLDAYANSGKLGISA